LPLASDDGEGSMTFRLGVIDWIEGEGEDLRFRLDSIIGCIDSAVGDYLSMVFAARKGF